MPALHTDDLIQPFQIETLFAEGVARGRIEVQAHERIAGEQKNARRYGKKVLHALATDEREPDE